jgi:TRAP-type C4-dicarboxylate transport system permease small subunit
VIERFLTGAEDDGTIANLERYFEGYIALVLLAVVTVLVFVDVVNRTLRGTQFVWGLEVIEGLFIWITWLSAAFAMRHSSHLRFTLLREQWSARRNYVMYWVEWVLWFVVVGTIFWHSIPELERYVDAGRIVVGTNVPDALFYLAVPVGTATILVRVLQDILRVTRRYRGGDPLAPDASIEIEEGPFAAGEETTAGADGTDTTDAGPDTDAADGSADGTGGERR